MAIRVRRGLDSQRTSITFEIGEIAWCTDTEKLYIGDGSTAGGILIDDQSLTYNSTTNTITTADGSTVVISNIPSSSDTSNWDSAYDNMITGLSITGDTTKTLNLSQQDGGTLTVSYVDTYVHVQSSSSATWTVNHNMNKYPSVTVIDSANNVVEGEVEYISLNQLEITFSSGFSGTAYAN